MANQSLKNKKIVISAGASGIGWAITKVCISRGAQVFLCDINQKLINKINKNNKYKNKIFAYECDASNESEVINFFSKVLKKTKKIDALINNVGIAGHTGTLEKLDSEEWERTLQVNVVSHFYFTKQAIPIIKKNKKGSIINISSIMGVTGGGPAPNSPYHASKGGLVNLTRSLANEWGSRGIRVNSIGPTYTKTRLVKQLNADKEKLNHIIERTPLKRLAEVSEMAGGILYLASDASSIVTGHTLMLDGGWSAI